MYKYKRGMQISEDGKYKAVPVLKTKVRVKV